MTIRRSLYTMTEGPYTCIAESPEHASELLLECTGETLEDGDTWEQVEPSHRITVGFGCLDDLRDQLREAESCGLDLQDAAVVTRVRGLDWLAGSADQQVSIDARASWWARLPAGLLCSTEW